MKHRLWLFWIAMLAGAACGGNVDHGEEEPVGAAGSSNTAGAGDGTEDPNSRQLEPCEPGFDPSEEPNQECPFLGDDGLCYETRDDACDCVCPHDAPSVCIHSPIGNGATMEVWCQ